MGNPYAKVDKWIVKNCLGPDTVDVGKLVKLFVSDMEKGLTPDGSCLPMIPTFIEAEAKPPANVGVIAIDSGASNLRIAGIRFDAKGVPTIESNESYPVPGKIDRVTVDQYFDYLATRIAPIAAGKERVGFCFSFPARILPNKDGSIILFNKEIKVSGAEGRLLGVGLQNALSKKGVFGIKKTVVINDTIATAMGGRAQTVGMHYGGYLGLIYGGGINTCYTEQKSNIIKEPDLCSQGGKMIINVESGSFDKMVRGPIDIELDEDSHEPGRGLMEKMISGAYIGEVFRRAALKASEDEILGSLGEIRGGTTIEMSQFLHDPYVGPYANACSSEEDRAILWRIGSAIVERAAKLMAANVLAVAIKSGEGKNAMSPILVTGEGATLYKMKGLKGGIEHYVRLYSEANQNVFLEFTKVETGAVLGSAMAAYM